MAAHSTWKSIVNRFKESPKEVREYFKHLPKLAEGFPWKVSLGYLFARIEQAHNMAIYCGVVKLHQVNGNLAFKAIQHEHMTRDHFLEMFLSVFGRKIPGKWTSLLRIAENARDKALHGKEATGFENRQAVVKIIEYAEGFNEFVGSVAGFKPFGSLRGFKGKAKSMPLSTSRLVLKGLGFSIS